MTGVARCSDTTMAKATPITVTASWAPRRRRRASTMSASAPAGSVSRNIGSVVAIWTADTIIGSGLRLVISQLVDVSNIAMPTFDAELAIRMTVKARLPNTPQRDRSLIEASGTGRRVDGQIHSAAPPVAGARAGTWRTKRRDSRLHSGGLGQGGSRLPGRDTLATGSVRNYIYTARVSPLSGSARGSAPPQTSRSAGKGK